MVTVPAPTAKEEAGNNLLLRKTALSSSTRCASSLETSFDSRKPVRVLALRWLARSSACRLTAKQEESDSCWGPASRLLNYLVYFCMPDESRGSW